MLITLLDFMHFNPCFCRDILHQTFHGTFAHTLGTHIFVANVFSIKYFDRALDMLKCESLLPEMEKIEHKDPLRVLFCNCRRYVIATFQQSLF
ncbi:hypothetical protein B7992_07265 [Fibrobacter sp. UWH1]|nr:hypothetical protein B7992_07265 [Fibrobacter sp. UWH1]